MAGVLQEASPVARTNLPRYYLRTYIRINEKGDQQELKDPVLLDNFVTTTMNLGVPEERILKADPGDCDKANPCEELSMREEAVGINVSLQTTIRQVPVIASGIPHTPLRNQTSMKNTWLETRSCLSATASFKLWEHDQKHRTSH